MAAQTTEKERRAHAITAIHKGDSAHNWDPTEFQLGEIYDDLLSYFDQQEPSVANAIRYGMKCVTVGELANAAHMTYVVNYPEVDG